MTPQVLRRAPIPDIIFRYQLILDGFKEFLVLGTATALPRLDVFFQVEGQERPNPAILIRTVVMSVVVATGRVTHRNRRRRFSSSFRP
jgi:hypothetical protein